MKNLPLVKFQTTQSLHTIDSLDIKRLKIRSLKTGTQHQNGGIKIASPKFGPKNIYIAFTQILINTAVKLRNLSKSRRPRPLQTTQEAGSHVQTQRIF